MPATYEPIATNTLSSAAASITFSSIPATYTDLRVVFSNVKISSSSSNVAYLRFNADTGGNYSFTTVYGNGSGTFSVTGTSGDGYTGIQLNTGPVSTTIPQFYTADVFSYTASIFKTSLLTASQDQNGSGFVVSAVGLWRSTAAITSLTLVHSATDFATGTTATLYGIKNA